MDNHFAFEVPGGGLYYQVFYLLAFLTAYIILLVEGYRRKFPMLTWILVIACIRLFMVIGTKAFTYTLDDWRTMFDNHMLVLNSEKTIFGGLILGFIGYLIGKYWFRFRYHVLDTVAIALPLSASIQKIGCFFAGCCFGTPSALPWAVKYPVSTLPHYNHFQGGLITNYDVYSLPVHPVQLYEVLGGILVVLLVIKTRKYWKAEGSMLLSSLLFYSVIRFCLEFFRDPLSNKSGGEMAGIFKVVQWQFLVFAFVVILLLLWREKRQHPAQSLHPAAPPGIHSSLLFTLLMVLIFSLLHKWFTLTEIIATNMALVPAIILVIIEIFRTYTIRQYRWLYLCILILPVFLMSQTLPEIKKDSTGIKQYTTYKTVSGGYAQGEYINLHSIGHGEGCDRVQNTEYFNQHYNIVGTGYSKTKERLDKKETVKYGMNAYFGNHEETMLSDSSKDNTFVFGLNPYIRYDRKWVGVGGGLHIGNLLYSKENRYLEGYDKPKSGNLVTYIYPQFYFRVGVKRFLYTDFRLTDQFPTSSTGLRYQLSIGSGLGLKKGPDLRFGTTFMNSLFASASIPVQNRVVIEPFVWWGLKDQSYVYAGYSSPQYQFSLGLHYRFGHKVEKKTIMPDNYSSGLPLPSVYPGHRE
jgi:prolipoprotein diacylglyceryltransferase